MFLCFIVVSALWGQEAGSAVIVYGEGDGFTLVRGGEAQFYEVDYDDILGMFLYANDTILTEEDTFLEIQVTSNASLIKIAENTTFEFQRIGTTGGGTIKVVYGRIRAKINKLANNDEFEIMGTDTVAGVRGTDFGYDLTYGEDVSETESNETITTVYCFEGSVKVEQEDQASKIVKEILIEADQMVVTKSVEQEKILVAYEIEEEIDQFWDENKFVYEMASDTIVALSDEKDPDYYSDKVFGKKRTLKNTGVGLLFSSFIIGAGGAVAYSNMDDKSLSVGLITVGGASLLAGTIFLIQSAIIPDPPEEWVPSE